MVFLSLLPVAGPADQQGVVTQAAQPAGLDQVGGGVTEVGGDHNLVEALHPLTLHQFLQGLQNSKQRQEERWMKKERGIYKRRKEEECRQEKSLTKEKKWGRRKKDRERRRGSHIQLNLGSMSFNSIEMCS